MTRETVFVETPALRATSRSVTAIGSSSLANSSEDDISGDKPDDNLNVSADVTTLALNGEAVNRSERRPAQGKRIKIHSIKNLCIFDGISASYRFRCEFVQRFPR